MGVVLAIIMAVFAGKEKKPRVEEGGFPWGEVLWELRWYLLGIVTFVGGGIALYIFRDALFPHRNPTSTTEVIAVLAFLYFLYIHAQTDERLSKVEARLKDLEGSRQALD